MSERNATFSIVIVAFNSAEHLQTCIDRVAAQSFEDFLVTVVNNQCPQYSTRDIKLPDHRFRVIEADRNRGFAGGANLGAQSTNSSWVVPLNPDTLPNGDWLQELHQATFRHPNCSVFGSTILSMHENDQVDSFGDVISIFGIAWQGGHGMDVEALPNNDKIVFGPSGAAACYHRDVFEKFDGFDEDYFCYLEDVDFAFRLINAGYFCVQVRKAIVNHAGGASSSDEPDFPIYQTNKNNFRLIIKNAPLLLLLPMLSLHMLAQTYLIIRNIFSGGSRARLKGFASGLTSVCAGINARRSRQRSGSNSLRNIWRYLSWNPKSLRAHKIIAFDPDFGEHE